MSNEEMNGKKRLQEAFCRYDAIYLEENPPSKEEIQYSKTYLRYIARLKSRASKNSDIFFFGMKRRVAAMVAATMLMIAGAITTYAAREPIVEYFVDMKDTIAKIGFYENDISSAPATIEAIYTPTYLPDGFEFQQMSSFEAFVKQIWCNESGRTMRMNQYVLNGRLSWDIEDNEFEIFYHNDIKFIHSVKYETRSLLWNSTEYVFTLDMPDSVSLDEALLLVESLEIKN